MALHDCGMNEFCIFGHSNAALCLIIDTLLVLYKDDLNVEIILNIPVSEGFEYSFTGRSVKSSSGLR